MIQNLRTFLREASVGLYRARAMNALTIGIIAASFAIVGTFAIVLENLKGLAAEWDRVQIHAYLHDDAVATRATEVQALVSDLRERPIVKDARYVSREEAMSIFKESFADLAATTDLLGTNPFPASIEIAVSGESENRRESIEALLAELKGSALVELVQDNDADAHRLRTALGTMASIGLGLAAILGTASAFIVFNVIRLTVNARSQEIGIMRLVGATPGFIRGPFLVEGMMQGGLGALVALAVLYAAQYAFSDYATRSGNFIASALCGRYLPPLRALELAAGGLAVGLAGSALSLRRFLAESRGAGA